MTHDQEKFLKDNFYKMTNRELGAILGVTARHISYKAKMLGLKPKDTKPNKKPPQILNYKLSDDTLLELEGRRKTAAIPRIKDTIPDDKVLNIREFINKKTGYVPKSGRVVNKTQHLIVVQTKNYKECFRVEDIYTKKTIVREMPCI